MKLRSFGACIIFCGIVLQEGKAIAQCSCAPTYYPNQSPVIIYEPTPSRTVEPNFTPCPTPYYAPTQTVQRLQAPFTMIGTTQGIVRIDTESPAAYLLQGSGSDMTKWQWVRIDQLKKVDPNPIP
jgi:hypothetical protein